MKLYLFLYEQCGMNPGRWLGRVMALPSDLAPSTGNTETAVPISWGCGGITEVNKYHVLRVAFGTKYMFNKFSNCFIHFQSPDIFLKLVFYIAL